MGKWQYTICMKYGLAILFLGSALAAEVLKPGTPAPPISARPLDGIQPFRGWEAYRGNFVVVDFWATWCAPCLLALDKTAALEREFTGQRIRFLTVANDDMERVKRYFKDKGLHLQTFVDQDESVGHAFGITGIPAAAVIDPEGRVAGITPGENVTAAVIRMLLNGKKVNLPPFNRINNPFWDQDEITWQDGVLPVFQVVIKPIDVHGGGTAYKAGSNHLSGDGAIVQAMIQSAWRTDSFHVDIRGKLPEGAYRFAATVPKGREGELFPAFQDALQRTFGLQAHWEEQQRDVLILTHDGSVSIKESTSEPLSQFQRGKITMKKQSTAELAGALPNWMRKVVIDETGLTGRYDFDLDYRDDGPNVLIDSLRERYGLILALGRRPIRVLVVKAAQ